MFPVKSMYTIRVEHLTLLQQIEDAEGVLDDQLESALVLTQEEFEAKAVSYGFVVKAFDDNEKAIDAELKRLGELKAKTVKRKELFKAKLDEAMRQFGIEKITTPTLSLSYRKSKSLEVVEGFEDTILKYLDVTVGVSAEKVDAAKAELPEGESDPLLDMLQQLLDCFKSKLELSKTSISQLLKEGTVVPGARIVEKKNLQIK